MHAADERGINGGSYPRTVGRTKQGYPKGVNDRRTATKKVVNSNRFGKSDMLEHLMNSYSSPKVINN